MAIITENKIYRKKHLRDLREIALIALRTNHLEHAQYFLNQINIRK